MDLESKHERTIFALKKNSERYIQNMRYSSAHIISSLNYYFEKLSHIHKMFWINYFKGKGGHSWNVYTHTWNKAWQFNEKKITVLFEKKNVYWTVTNIPHTHTILLF